MNKLKYNTKYECKYLGNLEQYNIDKLNNDEIEYIRDIIYRDDLINIFDIEDDLNIFEVAIPLLHDKIVQNEDLKKCLKKASNFFMSEDTEIGLCILYSFDYLNLTHKCISKYLEENNVDYELLTELFNKIKIK